MKKLFFLIVVMTMSFGLCFAKEFSKPFEFTVFDMSKSVEIFQGAMPHFSRMYSGQKPSEKSMEQFLEMAYGKDAKQNDLISLFLRAHFRETENPLVQKFIKNNMNKAIPKDESKRISYMYNANKTKSENGGVQFRYKDTFNEGIYFHMMQEIPMFNNKFITYVPYSNWQAVKLNASNEKQTLIAGGVSSALIINILKESYNKLPNKVKSTKNVIAYDLTNVGVLKDDDADKTVLEFLENTNERFVFQLKLYDESTKTVYTIKYKYSMYENNMNYEIFDELKRHLLYYSFFTYLQK